MSDAEKIAQLNDAHRAKVGRGGIFYQTDGVSLLPMEDQFAIHEKVREFSDFKAGDNPYGERDFGAFMHNDEKLYWKIDYYSDTSKTMGSEDPSDPEQTIRVLTIMFAREY